MLCTFFLVHLMADYPPGTLETITEVSKGRSLSRPFIFLLSYSLRSAHEPTWFGKDPNMTQT